MAVVPTRDAKKARSFYEGVLGLRFVSEDPFALVPNANRMMVRVTKVPEFEPQPFTIVGWEVSSIEDAMSSLQARGVNFETYGFKG